MATVLAVVGTVVSTCGLINDLRKALQTENFENQREVLFKEVKHTEGIISDLGERLKARQDADDMGNYEVLQGELEKLQNNLNATKEFLEWLIDHTPSRIRISKCKRVSKDIAAHISVLQISMTHLIHHIEICNLFSAIEVQEKRPLRDDDIGNARRDLDTMHSKGGIEGSETEINEAKQELENKGTDRLVHDDLYVSSSDLSDFEEIGVGTWGPIKKAKLNGIHDVVVKYIDDVGNDDVVTNFRKEAENLVTFWYGYVVQLLGICDQEDQRFLVLEFMHKGCLGDLLHKSGELLEPKTRVKMALDAAKAVLQVDAVMLHTAIKSDKFLVDKDYNVKIADLKFAKTFSSCRRYLVGPKIGAVDHMLYICPERFVPAPYTEKCEIYSLGIVLWEILSQSKPFSTLEKELDRKPNFVEVKAFVKDNRKEELSVEFGNMTRNSILNKLVQDCRDLNPARRPSLIDIVNELEGILSFMEEETLV